MPREKEEKLRSKKKENHKKKKEKERAEKTRRSCSGRKKVGEVEKEKEFMAHLVYSAWKTISSNHK